MKHQEYYSSMALNTSNMTKKAFTPQDTNQNCHQLSNVDSMQSWSYSYNFVRKLRNFFTCFEEYLQFSVAAVAHEKVTNGIFYSIGM